MHDARSITVHPLDDAELHVAPEVTRSDRTSGTLAYQAARFRFLSERMCGKLDLEASLGVALMEADLLMCLARNPACDERQFRLKATLFRCVQPDLDGTNIAAMLMAALHADAVRLGLATDDGGIKVGRA